MDIFEASDAFHRHLAVLGRSERTQKDYRKIVETFVEFQVRRRRLVLETTSEDLGEYVLRMKARGLSETGDFLVLGKGGFVRQGLVSGIALRDLHLWVRVVRPTMLPVSRALLLAPMGAGDIQVMMRVRSEATGIGSRYQYPSGASRGVLTPHALRHLMLPDCWSSVCRCP